MVPNVLAPDALVAFPDEVDPDMEADTLVTNEQGEPYTELTTR